MGSRRTGELLGQLETLFRAGAIGGLPDAQLLERFVASRDEAGEAAFRALVQRHGPMVLRVCRGVLHDPHAAEDAFQVTFLALARKAGSIRKHDSIASWLHGTAHRVALKARTAARRRQARESRAAGVAGSDRSQPSLEAGELSPILHEEIARLPAKYRAPIVLCYLEGMTQDQAAIELGWPAGTVRGRMARARDLLRSRLTRRGLALSAGLSASGTPADAAAVGLSAALIEATVRAALGRSTAGRLSRAAALLLRAILRDMAVARIIRLVAPLAIIAGLAGGAAVFLSRGGTDRAGVPAPDARIVPVARAAPIDLAGDPLPDGALARLGITRFAPGTLIHDVAYSPDGHLLASTDRDGHLDLWDAATGQRRLEIAPDEKDGMRIQGMAFAPDGRSMAAHTDKATILHDTASGRPIHRFEEKSRVHEWNAQPQSLAFSGDGSMLAASFFDAPIVLWEVGTGRRIRGFDAESQKTSALAFTPDGKGLVSSLSALPSPEPPRPGRKAAGPEQSLIQVWDVATGREIGRIELGKVEIGQMALAPDGETVAVEVAGASTGDGKGRPPGARSSDWSIRLRELATGRELRRFGGKGVIPRELAFSPDGTVLASGEEAFDLGGAVDNIPRTTALHLWDTATGREIRRWEVRATGTMCLAFAPGGTTLAWVGGNENVIRFWDPATGGEVRPQAGHRGAIGDAVFTPDGRSLATVSEDRTLRFWDAATGAETRRVEASDDRIWFSALSADGRTLAAGGGFKPSRLWDVASGRMLREFSVPGEHFTHCGDLSADGKVLATSADTGVILWDTATGQRRAGKGQPTSQFESHMIKALQFAPDGRSVATLGGDWVRFWDVGRAEETHRFALPNKGRLDGFMLDGARLAYSPDGKVLAASSERDGRIFLLDVATGRELDRLDGPAGNQFKALAFSPDGKVLAMGIDTGPRAGRRELAIRLWDVAGRRELGRVPAHRAYIRSLAFSPDGRRLVSASEDATALVWDVARIAGRSTGVAEPRGSTVRGN